MYGNFAVIHAAPEDQRPALVKRMIDEEWTIEETRREFPGVSERRQGSISLIPVGWRGVTVAVNRAREEVILVLSRF